MASGQYIQWIDVKLNGKVKFFAGNTYELSLDSPYGSALLSALEKAMFEKRPVVVEVAKANGTDQVTGITIKME